MWQWHILYPKSMTQLVSESVILWQRTVEGGSCFLPPQPSWAKLWRKTRHKTESSQKSTMFPTKRAKKKTVTRLSILRECRVTWTVSGPRVSVSAKHKLLRSSARHLQSSEWHQWTVQWTLQANWAEWARECLVRIKFSLSFLLFDKEMLQRFRKVSGSELL